MAIFTRLLRNASRLQNDPDGMGGDDEVDLSRIKAISYDQPEEPLHVAQVAGIDEEGLLPVMT